MKNIFAHFNYQIISHIQSFQNWSLKKKKKIPEKSSFFTKNIVFFFFFY